MMMTVSLLSNHTHHLCRHIYQYSCRSTICVSAPSLSSYLDLLLRSAAEAYVSEGAGPKFLNQSHRTNLIYHTYCRSTLHTGIWPWSSPPQKFS